MSSNDIPYPAERASPEANLEWSILHLAPDEQQEARAAIERFSKIFGPDWVHEQFASVNPTTGNHHMRGQPPMVQFLTSLWPLWEATSALPGSERLQERWTHGLHEQGVLSEVIAAGRMILKGENIFLEPNTDDGRKADLGWVHEQGNFAIEVSRKSGAVAMKDFNKGLGKIATYLRDATDVLQVIGWFQPQHQTAASQLVEQVGRREIEAERVFKDFMMFALAPGIDALPGPDRQAALEQPMVAISLHIEQNSRKSAVVHAPVPMRTVKKWISEETSQLPKSGNGILILDVTGMKIPIDSAANIVEDCFTTDSNTRVSTAVVLSCSASRELCRVQLIQNPHAKVESPAALNQALLGIGER